MSTKQYATFNVYQQGVLKHQEYMVPLGCMMSKGQVEAWLTTRLYDLFPADEFEVHWDKSARMQSILGDWVARNGLWSVPSDQIQIPLEVLYDADAEINMIATPYSLGDNPQFEITDSLETWVVIVRF